MITCIVVDDEPSALDVIAIHAAKIPELKILGLFYDPYKARDFLKDNPVDVVFLDINMPGINGLQLILPNAKVGIGPAYKEEFFEFLNRSQ